MEKYTIEDIKKELEVIREKIVAYNAEKPMEEKLQLIAYALKEDKEREGFDAAAIVEISQAGIAAVRADMEKYLRSFSGNLVDLLESLFSQKH